MDGLQIHAKVLDMGACDALWQVYSDTQFIKMCRDILRKRLFSDGIQFLKGFKTKTLMKPDLQMTELIEDYWTPFARDALDCILVMGIVPFKLFTVGGETVPIIPTPGTYRIFYELDETGTMRFHGKTKGQVPQTLTVMSDFGYSPTYTARMTSIVATCVPNSVFLQSLHDEVLTSEFLKNNPVLYSESAQKEISENEGISYDFFADAQELKRLPNTTFQRSERDIMQLKAQRKAYSQALEFVRTRRNKSSAQMFAEKNAAGALQRLVPLPPGQKLVKISSSSARNDFVNIVKNKQDELAAAFGIPRSMVMNDSNTKADTSGQHELFRSTVIFWQQLLGKLMTTVHSSIRSDKHEDALKEINKSQDANKGNLYKLKEKECVLIHFPISIFGTSNEELRELYEEEIIDRKTYATYRLKNAGMSLDLLFRKDDPLTSQEKKNQYVEVPKAQALQRFDTLPRKTSANKKDSDLKKETNETKIDKEKDKDKEKDNEKEKDKEKDKEEKENDKEKKEKDKDKEKDKEKEKKEKGTPKKRKKKIESSKAKKKKKK